MMMQTTDDINLDDSNLDDSNLDEHLLDLDGTPSSHSYTSDITLLKAANSGNLNLVKDLTEQKQHLWNKLGNSALYFAAGGGHVEVVNKYLIDEQGCSHSLVGNLKQTPFHTAAQYGQLSVVSYLLFEQHVEPCLTDKFN